MFSFLSSLFGGVYYIFKYANSKSQSKLWDYNKNKKKQIQNSICDEFYEKEILTRWNDEDYRNEIYEMIGDDMLKIYGDNWKEFFKFSFPTYINSFFSSEDYILSQTLKNQGLI